MIVPINSAAAGPIKAGITRRMANSQIVLVIIGRHSHDSGWIAFEIDKAKELKKNLVGVKVDRKYTTPEGLLNAGARWALSFTHAGVISALNNS